MGLYNPYYRIQTIANNVFILKNYLFMGLYNPYRTRKTQDLWIYIILVGLATYRISRGYLPSQ